MPDLLAGAEPPISLHEQVREVRRELHLRRRHYGRWITAGKLTAAEAARQIAIMAEVLRTLEGVAQGGAVPGATGPAAGDGEA